MARMVPLLLLGLLVVSAPDISSAAYRIHLKNGSSIDVRAYQEQQGALVYERFGGSVSIPRNQVLRIEELVAAPPASAEDRARSRLEAVAGKIEVDLENLARGISIEGDALTVVVGDLWYSLKAHERERILEYLRLLWMNESLKRGYPRSGIYLVKVKDAWGKVLERVGAMPR